MFFCCISFSRFFGWWCFVVFVQFQTSTNLHFNPPLLVLFRCRFSLTTGPFGGSCQIHGPISMESEEVTMSMSTLDVDAPPPTTQPDRVKSPIIKNPGYSHLHCPTELHRSCFCVRFIAEHTRMLEDSVKVKEDWKYVAMVLDRLFLWIFTLAVLVGTAGIILQAPTLYDDRIPIDKKFSDYASSTVVRWESAAIKKFSNFYCIKQRRNQFSTKKIPLFFCLQVSTITIWVNNKQQQHEYCITDGFMCNFNDECLLCFPHRHSENHLKVFCFSNTNRKLIRLSQSTRLFPSLTSKRLFTHPPFFFFCKHFPLISHDNCSQIQSTRGAQKLKVGKEKKKKCQNDFSKKMWRIVCDKMERDINKFVPSLKHSLP